MVFQFDSISIELIINIFGRLNDQNKRFRVKKREKKNSSLLFLTKSDLQTFPSFFFSFVNNKHIYLFILFVLGFNFTNFSFTSKKRKLLIDLNLEPLNIHFNIQLEYNIKTTKKKRSINLSFDQALLNLIIKGIKFFFYIFIYPSIDSNIWAKNQIQLYITVH